MELSMKFLRRILAKFGFVKTHKLKASYTLEKAEILENQFGLDLETELVNSLTEEIAKEEVRAEIVKILKPWASEPVNARTFYLLKKELEEVFPEFEFNLEWTTPGGTTVYAVEIDLLIHCNDL